MSDLELFLDDEFRASRTNSFETRTCLLLKDYRAAIWAGFVLSLGVIAVSCTTEMTEELLVADDLPAGIDWEARSVTPEFWDESLTFPMTVEWCSVAVPGRAEHSYKVISLPPLDGMTPRVATSFEGGRAGLHEVVYSGTEDAVSTAFDAIAAQMDRCLADFDPRAGFTPEAVEEGWYWEADRYLLPQVGEASYAIAYRAFDSDGHSTTYWTDHTIAVVVSGERLLVVELYEGYSDGTLSSDDFDEVLTRAVERLAA